MWQLLAGGALSLLGNIVGGNKQAKAAQQGADAQAQAAREANQIQLQMFNQARHDAEPWRQAGQVGLQEYMANLGLSAPTQQQGYPQPSTYMGYETGTRVGGYGASYGSQGIQNTYPMQQDYAGQAYLAANPDVAADAYFAQHPLEHYQKYGQGEGRAWGQPAASQQPSKPSTAYNPQTQQDAFAKFRATPGYQFGLDEGRKALDASATARGGLFSGAAGKALQRYGNDYADQQGYTPYMNRLASLAGMGQTQNSTTASLGANYATNAGNNLNNAAQARASGLMARGNAQASMWNNGLGSIGQFLSNAGGWGGV